ncbi:MAG: tyrosine-type recombinase/integrase [Spirosoma sp.]|nr:tyrosine-type recombinase/integrase [Spirosoma sp.]
MASYKTIYNRKKQTDRNGKALIQIEVYLSGGRRYFQTSEKIRPDQWNAGKSEVKGDPLANQRIRVIRQALEEFELTFARLHKRPFRLADFDLMSEQRASDERPEQSFQDFFREQLALDQSSVKPGTHQRKLRVHDRLLRYHGRPVRFTDLTYTLINGFDQSLRNEHGYDDSYIAKEHSILKSYVVRAIKSGLLPIHANPYDQFRAKRKNVDKIILSEPEIRRLEQVVLPDDKQHLRIYLDAWLLAYYTTLRISDITALRLQNVVETEKGLQLELKQEKTGDMVYIPLWLLHLDEGGISKATTILRRYWPISHIKPFFDRSHFHLNKRFKLVLKLAEISKLITFHSARHTGITHLAKKLPLTIVQRIAGHRKIQTTMGYLHLTNQDVEQALEQVNW